MITRRKNWCPFASRPSWNKWQADSASWFAAASRQMSLLVKCQTAHCSKINFDVQDLEIFITTEYVCSSEFRNFGEGDQDSWNISYRLQWPSFLMTFLQAWGSWPPWTCYWLGRHLPHNVKRLAMCSTRGGSQGMYVIFASATQIGQPTLALKTEKSTRNIKTAY